MKPVIILGSERKQGNTYTVVKDLSTQLDCPIIDLLDYNIARYNYEGTYSSDDEYIALMDECTRLYDTFIFATPVYWYAMSGLMKIYFDRITDLLKTHKSIGRRLREKNMAVLSNSNSSNLGDAFWLPFEHSAEYLGMNFLSSIHTYEDKNHQEQLKTFIQEIQLNSRKTT